MTFSPFRYIPSIFRKNRPIQLTLFLTRKCNARCPFCFYLSQPPPKNAPPELSLDEINTISSSFGNLLWLAFSGGEIFLRPDLVEISQLFYKKNKPAIMLFPSNGLLTDTIYQKMETILESCPQSNIVVKLSIDGPPEIHDPIRGVKNSFQKTMATYEALRDLVNRFPNFDMGINSVFCAENQNRMEELLSFVQGLEQITTHTVSLMRGSVSNSEVKGINLDKYLRTIRIMEENLKKKKAPIYGFSGARLKAAQDILQRRLIYETATQKKRLISCYAGILNLVLSETGELFPCESFDMGMGNVRDFNYDIKSVLKSEKAKNIMRAITGKSCFCTHECYFMTNILFNPAQFPALLKEYVQL